MNEAGQRKQQRTLRHAAPERVRELLHAYRRRAARERRPPGVRGMTPRPGAAQREAGAKPR